MNFIPSLNSRLILINILAATLLFIISIVFLYKVDTLENLSVNKLKIVNNRQHVLEDIRYKSSQLNRELSQYLLEYRPANAANITARAGSIIVKIEDAKVIGGIDLLKLAVIGTGFEKFLKNSEQLYALVSEINKIEAEIIAREISKIDQLFIQLKANTYYQETYFLANSLHQLSDHLSALKHRIFSHRSVLRSNEIPMVTLLKTLQDQVVRFKLDQLNLSDQEQFKAAALHVENLADAVTLLQIRKDESRAIEQLLLNDQLSSINKKLDTLIIDMNKNIEHYNVITKEALSSSRVTIWTLGSGLILVSLFSGWYLRRRLHKAVESIAITVEKISEGDFKAIQKNLRKAEIAPLFELDEFKRITVAIKAMTDYQQRMIFDIDTACQGLSMGILNQHTSFQYRGDYKLIEHSLNSNKDNTLKLVTEISEACDAILTGDLSTELSSPIFCGDYKPINVKMNAISNNLQLQLVDLLKVTRGMESGLLNKAQFSFPGNYYYGDCMALQEALHACVTNLSLSAQWNNDQNWLKSGLSDMNRQLTGEQPLETLSKTSIDFIANYLNAPIGYYYRSFEDPKIGKAIRLISHYGVLMDEETRQTRYKFVYPEGVGLIGQVFIKPEIFVKKLSEDERKPVSQSGIANALLNYIVVVPLIHEGRIEGVLELGLYKEPSTIQKEFLSQIMSTLGIAMNVAISRDQMNLLLEQSQNQTEELAIGQFQLAESNKMLQQKALQLEDNQLALEVKNKQFEQASITMEEKNHELIQASQYKSEFLANMSHELRSPLNSLLILSKLLINNKKGNMDESEVKYAEIIHRSGSDLLVLIEDILDHAKIEAGKTEISISQESVAGIVKLLSESFNQIALDKKIEYSFSVDQTLDVVNVDKQRVIQVLTNLLSNAFKFTERGKVSVSIRRLAKGESVGLSESCEQDLTFDALCFCVEDTGIGIAQENKERVFKAFSQEDGTTSRRFGGTGLGLSITQHLVELMEGFLHLETELDKGSKFYVYLPTAKPESIAIQAVSSMDAASHPLIPTHLNNAVKRILVIDVDDTHESSLTDVMRKKGFDFEGVNGAHEASEKLSQQKYQGVVLFEQSLRENQIDYEQLRLQLNVKDIPALVLDNNARTVDVPISPEQEIELDEILKFMSEIEKNLTITQSEIMQDYFDKTELLVSKKVLIVDDHMSNVFALTAILETHNVEYIVAENGHEAIAAIGHNNDIDLILMDIMMPDLNGYETIKAIRLNHGYENIPIIALTAKAMPEDRNKCIQAGANDYMTKPLDTQKLLTLMKMWLVTSPNLEVLTESY